MTSLFLAALALVLPPVEAPPGAIQVPVHLVVQEPAAVTRIGPGAFLVDFGRVAFGNVLLSPPAGAAGAVTVHFGEALREGRIDRTPPGTVRYAVARATLGEPSLVVAPPPDGRNTRPPAILTPKEWGVVLPFRWVEIEGWPGELRPGDIVRRAAFAATWDEGAAAFECSDDMLNRVGELCRYSIKATTFAGVYVDGDRERIPYEADAYLNQLSHYFTDSDPEMARVTFDHLMVHGTWPTEWASHLVFMAHADWLQTGDAEWLGARYESLKAKLLLERVGPDGLVQSSEEQRARGDIVDWPAGERDGYVFTSVNTVVNAFHLRALGLMVEMGQALGREAEAADYEARERETRAAFQRVLFDDRKGLYRDGVATDHTSLHANLFPLAFGLVPDDRRDAVADWLVQRGMRCSVYAAQYLLEGLFESGRDAAAIALMVAPGDRSWRHMVESGATITWEAWDRKYKPNLDWNHAWGAAPANLLPRYVLGAQPATPGWRQARIRPHPGPLTFARGKIPTPLGSLRVEWTRGETFALSLSLPRGMTARVDLPTVPGATQVLVDGKPVAADRVGPRWVLVEPLSGSAKVELR